MKTLWPYKWKADLESMQCDDTELSSLIQTIMFPGLGFTSSMRMRTGRKSSLESASQRPVRLSGSCYGLALMAAYPPWLCWRCHPSSLSLVTLQHHGSKMKALWHWMAMQLEASPPLVDLTEARLTTSCRDRLPPLC